MLKNESRYQQATTQEPFGPQTGINPFHPDQLYTPEGISPNASFSPFTQDNLKIFDWMKKGWRTIGRIAYQWEREVNEPGRRLARTMNQEQQNREAEKQRYITYYEQFYRPNPPGIEGNEFLTEELARETLASDPRREKMIPIMTHHLIDWRNYREFIEQYGVRQLSQKHQQDYRDIIADLHQAGIVTEYLWQAGFPDRSFDSEITPENPSLDE